MIKHIGSSLILLLFYLSASAQNWSLISKQPLNVPLEYCNIDRFGNIYLSDKTGNLRKLNPLGEQIAQFASQHYGKLSALESWTSLRVFLFYQDIQQFVYLDRFLNQSEFLDFSSAQFRLVTLASPSSDNQLWIIDSGPATLAKYDINFGSVTFSQVLNQLIDAPDLKPNQLFEYQNRVYLGDSNLGILVFDNLGNYIQTIDKPGGKLVYPFKEELYFLKGNRLHFISIYNQNQRIIELPENQTDYKHVLVTEKSIVLASSQDLFIYSYTPR